MSGIFGLFDRSGESVPAGTLSAMQDAMEYWQADATGSWISGPVGLGHLMLWNTPESRLDSQPRVLECEDGSQVITADVRLDNRGELFEWLSGEPALAGRKLESITDTEFLLAAYREWGEDSPAKLLGDFAYARNYSKPWK